MNTDLSGKRALVCGSTQGIGRASAEALATLGASVTLLARDEDRLRLAAGELPVVADASHHWLAADFSNPDTVREIVHAALDEDRPWHILVNNTGGPPGGRAIDADPTQYESAFRAHILCNQILAALLVPGMKRAGYGRIVNIISTSVKAPIPGLGVSNTVRGAVAAWAKTIATELAPDGITVNNVLPGFTDTQRLRSLIRTKAKKQSTTEDLVEEEMRASVPMGRFGRPEEIAAAVAFLCTPAAAYISGINLPVDGGRTPSL